MFYIIDIFYLTYLEAIMRDVNPSSKSKFWDRYLALLAKQHIRENARRWYVKQVEAYIHHLDGSHLLEQTANSVSHYLEMIGRNPRIEGWQYFQNIDALYILFCLQLRVAWASDIDWPYYKNSARSLDTNHLTNRVRV